MSVLYFLHSLLRWAVLLFGLLSVINALSGISGKTYTSGNKKINLFFLISCDIQLLVGLGMYFSSPWFKMLKENASEVMKNATARFFAVEHITMMIIAIILVHIGYSSIKKATTDNAKYKKALIFFGLALLLILAAIPWPFREAVARPLLRGL